MTERDERGRLKRLPDAMRAKMWPKGYAPNPSGRSGVWHECLRFCRENSFEAAKQIDRLSRESDDDRVRLLASQWIYERAWGKASPEYDPKKDRPPLAFNPADYTMEQLDQIRAALQVIMAVQDEKEKVEVIPPET